MENRYNMEEIINKAEDKYYFMSDMEYDIARATHLDDRVPTSFVEDIDGGDNFINYIEEYFNYIENVYDDDIY